jgi:phosphatidylglycerophosphate synthase
MGVSFGSSWFGKWKMILQSFSIPLVIVLTVNFKTGGAETHNVVARWICYIVVYATVIVTILSGLPYVTRLRQVTGKQ